LLGAAMAQVLVTLLLALVFSRIGRVFKALRPLQVAASGLLVFGMVWFFLRLRS
jgi:hypothetical protein